VTINSVALSGLQAAERRVSVSADNIANARSTSVRDARGNTVNEPFVPNRVEAIQQPGGGVRTRTAPVEPATITVLSQNGQIELPNVDFATELVEQQMATYDFRANLNVLETQKEFAEALIDILA
jgi:flagellar basal-body rod protein FlgC